MGGRHLRFHAEVEVPAAQAARAHEVASHHGLVVQIAPTKLGLSSPDQVEALRKAFPGLSFAEPARPKGEAGPAAGHKAHSRGFLALVEEARSHIREVTVQEAHERVRSNREIRFLDVREDHEWNQARAAGATHLGRGILERDIEGLIPDRDTEVILYCGGGFRSALSADSMQKMGYRNVSSMAGGFRGWREAGLPEES